MKLIIAGSRHLELTTDDLAQIMDRWQLFHTVTTIISGGSKGVDSVAEAMAHEESIPFVCFPANWEKHGRKAGPIRNRAMAQTGDALLLVWDGKSSGSRNMKAEMKRMDKPIYEIVLT